MQIRALLFNSSTPSDKPIPSTLEFGKQLDVGKTRSSVAPAAYVLELEHLPRLRSYKDLIVDRGIKHKAKGLSKLLLGLEKIPLIDGDFSGSSQIGRSVKTLIKNAVERGELNLYLIGVEQEAFDELWATVGTKSARKIRPRKNVSPSDKKALPEANDNTASRLLLKLMGPCKIPDGLFHTYVGNSIEVQLVRLLIFKGASTDSPALILGDTGTGKSIIAREIHQHSKRKTEKFRTLNCAAIPTELLEMELFGVEKGVIDSWHQLKIGLWEDVGDGTLFLDEIGDLAASHQAKILRALEDGTIRRVGGLKDIKVTARVITATNRELFSMAQAGHFREDLYYRLRGFLIRTPALRDHSSDIPMLAQFFWQKITGSSKSLLPKAIVDQLQSYRWPGNARELKMLLSSLYAFFGKDHLRVEHLKVLQEFEGRLSVDPRTQPSPEEEIRLHRVKCLRHLRRVDEFIHAVLATLRPFLEHRKIGKQLLASIQQSLQYQLTELELLCQDPLFFYSEHAFSGVYRLKGKLAYFQGLLETGAKEALHYWQKEVEEELQVVQSTVFKEVERILKKV